ncbi:MAG: hypothetical protein ACXV3F_00305 [Frankiaceae bacterium]
MSVAALFSDRFCAGWYRESDGRVETELPSPWSSELSDDSHVTIVCPRCGEPAWHITRHAVEKHGDADVEVLPVLPGKTPPEWFQPDWI